MTISATAITNYDHTALHVVHGTYASSGTSASIATGLSTIVSFFLQSVGSATSPYGSVSGGTITATTASSDTGFFIAFGY